jgi:ATP phosphoribosyltransferase regulatory subunit HisZ
MSDTATSTATILATVETELHTGHAGITRALNNATAALEGLQEAITALVRVRGLLGVDSGTEAATGENDEEEAGE